MPQTPTLLLALLPTSLLKKESKDPMFYCFAHVAPKKLSYMLILKSLL